MTPITFTSSFHPSQLSGSLQLIRNPGPDHISHSAQHRFTLSPPSLRVYDFALLWEYNERRESLIYQRGMPCQTGDNGLNGLDVAGILQQAQEDPQGLCLGLFVAIDAATGEDGCRLPASRTGT